MLREAEFEGDSPDAQAHYYQAQGEPDNGEDLDSEFTWRQRLELSVPIDAPVQPGLTQDYSFLAGMA